MMRLSSASLIGLPACLLTYSTSCQARLTSVVTVIVLPYNAQAETGVPGEKSIESFTVGLVWKC